MGSGAVTNPLASAVCAIDCGSVRMIRPIVFTSTRCACSAICIRFAIAISAVACIGVSTVKVGHQWQCRVGVLKFWSASQNKCKECMGATTNRVATSICRLSV